MTILWVCMHATCSKVGQRLDSESKEGTQWDFLRRSKPNKHACTQAEFLFSALDGGIPEPRCATGQTGRRKWREEAQRGRWQCLLLPTALSSSAGSDTAGNPFILSRCRREIYWLWLWHVKTSDNTLIRAINAVRNCVLQNPSESRPDINDSSRHSCFSLSRSGVKVQTKVWIVFGGAYGNRSDSPVNINICTASVGYGWIWPNLMNKWSQNKNQSTQRNSCSKT